MTRKFNESLDFVAKFYREGAFKANLNFITHSRYSWLRRNIAAASVAAIVLAASAAIYLYLSPAIPQPSATQPTETTVDTPVMTAETPQRLEFDDMPLSMVVKEIEKAYNVKISGLPADSDIHLTLSYEGNAYELIDTINQILDTNLKVEQNNQVEQ